MRILVTGFEPFGGEAINPSWEVVCGLPHFCHGAEILPLRLPGVFGRAGDLLTEAFLKEKPEAVLCLGQAGGRTALTPELVALNLQDARIPDNDGQAPCQKPVVPGGPDGRFATLPVRAMVEAIRQAGIPASLSYTAGTYVCNDLMYRVLDLLAGYPGCRGGFLHLPYLPAQAASKPGTASMALDDMVRGVDAAILAIVQGVPETGQLGQEC